MDEAAEYACTAGNVFTVEMLADIDQRLMEDRCCAVIAKVHERPVRLHFE